MLNSVCYIHHFLLLKKWAPIKSFDFEIKYEFELPQVSSNVNFRGLHAFSVQNHWWLKKKTLHRVLSSWMLTYWFWVDNKLHRMRGQFCILAHIRKFSPKCKDFQKFEDPFSLVTQFQRWFSVLIVVLPEGLKEQEGRSCVINNICKTITDLVQKYEHVKIELTSCSQWCY